MKTYIDNQYGIDINSLEKLISKPIFKKFNWGERGILIEWPAFRLEKISVNVGASADLDGDANFETTLWIEKGEGFVQSIKIGDFEIITLPPRQKWSIAAEKPMEAYLFYGPASAESEYSKKTKAFDYREKYWGNIQSIVSKDYSGKRIFVRQSKNASLEFHCNKNEGYYIHSGNLLLRLRAGRGQDQFFELNEGSSSFTPPGLMHQRGGLEDTVIIEISTRDDDKDSFLVEDGKNHPMPHLKKTICFDIDGCICSQTDGDYENAVPNQKAITVVNRLFNEGHKIILNSSRFMGRAGGNGAEAYNQGYDFTKEQLKGWGVLYHELWLGKPRADITIDDRAVFFNGDWDLIEKDIEKRLINI